MVECDGCSFSCFLQAVEELGSRCLQALGRTPRRVDGDEEASGGQPNRWEVACKAPPSSLAPPSCQMEEAQPLLLTVAQGPYLCPSPWR